MLAIVSLLQLPFLIPFIDFVYFGIILANSQHVHWTVIVLLAFWGWVYNNAITEALQVSLTTYQSGETTRFQHELQLSIFALMKWPLLLTAIYCLRQT